MTEAIAGGMLGAIIIVVLIVAFVELIRFAGRHSV